jgi:hypothetical protein
VERGVDHHEDRLMRVEGAADIRRTARALRDAGRGDLERDMGKAIRKAASTIVKPAIVARAGEMLPNEYAAVFAPSLQMRISSTRAGIVSLRVEAKGKKDLRDAAAVDAGQLRHPLFGNRGHWYVTKVKPGFATGAVDETADQVADAVGDAIDKIVVEVAGR